MSFGAETVQLRRPTDIDTSFYCALCLSESVSPIRSNCCHAIMCWECFANSSECACGDTPDPTSCVAVNKVLQECPHAGCNRTGSEQFLLAHVEVCEYGLVQCPLNADCDMVPRNELEEHVLHMCKFRLATCPNQQCSVHLRVGEIPAHVESCEFQEIDCPHECSSRFLRSQLANHVQECPRAPTTCPFKDFGCKSGTLPRSEYEEHMAMFFQDHMLLIGKEVRELKGDPDRTTARKERRPRRGMFHNILAPVASGIDEFVHVYVRKPWKLLGMLTILALVFLLPTWLGYFSLFVLASGFFKKWVQPLARRQRAKPNLLSVALFIFLLTLEFITIYLVVRTHGFQRGKFANRILGVWKPLIGLVGSFWALVFTQVIFCALHVYC